MFLLFDWNYGFLMRDIQLWIVMFVIIMNFYIVHENLPLILVSLTLHTKRRALTWAQRLRCIVVFTFDVLRDAYQMLYAIRSTGRTHLLRFDVVERLCSRLQPQVALHNLHRCGHYPPIGFVCLFVISHLHDINLHLCLRNRYEFCGLSCPQQL